MNAAQKILKPMLDAAEDRYSKARPGRNGCDRKARAEAAILALEDAYKALAKIDDEKICSCGLRIEDTHPKGDF